MDDDGARPLSERVPPHNVEAEQSVLGSMFLSADAVETCVPLVEPTDFYRPPHQRIFGAIVHLHGRGEAVDQITVAARLEATGELELAGGKPYLLDITGAVPTAANAEYYAGIVKRTSMLRQLIDAATRIQAISYAGPDDIDEVVAESEKLVFQVTNKRVSSNFQAIDTLMEEVFKEIELLYERKARITGVPTGYPDLDDILAGLHRGDLVILAARPAVGTACHPHRCRAGRATGRARFQRQRAASRHLGRRAGLRQATRAQAGPDARLAAARWHPLLCGAATPGSKPCIPLTRSGAPQTRTSCSGWRSAYSFSGCRRR